MHKFICVIISVFIIFIDTACCAAGGSPCVVCYNAGSLSMLATSDVNDQLSLGYIYNSVGGAYGGNSAMAETWFRRAAQDGEPSAMYQLYELRNAESSYRESTGVVVSAEEKKSTLSWLEKAAKNGYSVAQYELGQNYELGHLVKVDKVKALSWHILAARSNYVPAQLEVAATYKMASKKMVKKNLSKIIYWYKRASDLGSSAAQYGLCELYDPENEAADGYSPPEGRSYKIAYSLCLKAAKHGNSLAQSTLFNYYWNGYFVKKDSAKAYAWLSLSSLCELYGISRLQDNKLKRKIYTLLDSKEEFRAQELADKYQQAYGDICLNQKT